MFLTRIKVIYTNKSLLPTSFMREKGTYVHARWIPPAGTFAGDRLKKFYSSQQLQLQRTLHLDREVVPTLEDCLADNDDELSDVSDNFYDL